MTEEQRRRSHVMRMVLEERMSIKEASEALELSTRQIKRLKAGMKEQGDACLIHRNTNRKPAHALTEEEKARVVELARGKYAGANFAHLSELLAEHDGMSISRTSVSRICREAGMSSTRKHRVNPHPRRARKAQAGMLVQMDASPHQWFGEEETSLHGAIDDATGTILALHFAKSECLDAYFETMLTMVKKYGCPRMIYADRHTIFQGVTRKDTTVAEDFEGAPVPKSQFQRAIAELGITLIAALSPEAKGRIERLWETLQSRLPIELRLAGITEIEPANAFLPQFLVKLNRKFAVAAAQPQPAFLKLAPEKNASYILCKHDQRLVDRGGCFSYQSQLYQLYERGKCVAVVPRTTVTVLTSPRFGVKAIYCGKVYNVRPLPKEEKMGQRTQ